MRINKYLADHNYASRREADKLIAQGHVKINGKVAVIGQQVNEGDAVEVAPVVKERIQRLVYLAYNKPVGIVTHSPEPGQKSIRDVLSYRAPNGEHLAPIGRLDKDSYGLILLSNDGRVTKKMLEPEEKQEKEYSVTVDKPLTKNFSKQMERGVDIEGYITKPCVIEQTGSTQFSITLTEGKKHQIRRMCAALGYQVTDLQRTRIMNVQIGDLKEGEYRELKGEELKSFLKNLGL